MSGHVTGVSSGQTGQETGVAVVVSGHVTSVQVCGVVVPIGNPLLFESITLITSRFAGSPEDFSSEP